MLGLNELMIKLPGPDGSDFRGDDGGEGEYYYSGSTPDYAYNSGSGGSGESSVDSRQLIAEVGTGGGPEDEEPATIPGYQGAMPAEDHAVVDNYDTIPDILKKKMGSGDSRYMLKVFM